MKRTIGLNLKPPEKKCDDEKCPWHGTLSVRGKVFDGVVKSTKSAKSAVIEFGYNRFIKKYERYERRKTRIVAYNPACVKAKEGDTVVIAECRPLSKTKSFAVLSVREAGK